MAYYFQGIACDMNQKESFRSYLSCFTYSSLDTLRLKTHVVLIKMEGFHQNYIPLLGVNHSVVLIYFPITDDSKL